MDSNEVLPPRRVCYDRAMVERLESGLSAEQIRPLKRREYDRLVEDGAFEDERLELLKGWIVLVSPQGARHATVIRTLNKLLTLALSDRADVQVQSPLAVSDDSEPEPDLAVIEMGDYLAEHPATAHLVIEVAVTSQAKDRGIKAGLYAAAGVPEHWLVDLEENRVEVFTEPAGEAYQRQEIRQPGDAITLQRHPDLTVSVSDFLPPAAPA